jgi:hypothetical protein
MTDRDAVEATKEHHHSVLQQHRLRGSVTAAAGYHQADRPTSPAAESGQATPTGATDHSSRPLLGREQPTSPAFATLPGPATKSVL